MERRLLNSAAPPLGIDASKFGVVANTGADETAAIQALINSLAERDGVPDALGPVGGTIVLPAGTIDINGPLLVPSGVWLVGNRAGTTLYDRSTDPNADAIELYSPFTHNCNIGASLQNLVIHTVAGPAIGTYGATTTQVIDLCLSNVTISAGGAGINLSSGKVYHCEFENVLVTNNGGPALILGNSTETSVDNLVVGGHARPGFVASGAMVQINGQNFFRGGSVSGCYPDATSLSVQGVATFTGFSVSASLGGSSNNVAVEIINAHSIFFDTLGGISTNRRLQILGADEVDIGRLNVSGRFDMLATVVSIDNISHLAVNSVNGNRNFTLPASGTITYASVGNAGQSSLDPNTFIAPTGVFDASDYGAIPDGVTDDTAAIQAAIQAAARAGGGIVYLGEGTFNVSAALKLPSNVWLWGNGDGTLLLDTSTDPLTAAIQLVSAPGASSNINSAVENMMINTTVAEGIMIDPSLTGAVNHLQLVGLEMSTDGTSIDLHSRTVNYSDIDRVVVTSPGSTILWLGSPTAQGIGDYVRSLRIQGTQRSNFSLADKALIELYGTVTVQNGSIESVGAMALPLYISGTVTINGLYMEYPAALLPNGVEVEIQNAAHVSIDQFNLLLTTRQLQIINSPDVRIGEVDIQGTLANNLSVDGNSHVTIGTVFSPYDAGELDSPLFSVSGVYNKADEQYLPNVVPNSSNLLADPTFSTFSGGATNGAWTITWGDPLGAIAGTATVIQTANGPTLQIRILSNPNLRSLAIFGNLNVPQFLAGRNAFVRMRIDASNGASQHVWSTDYQGCSYTDVTGSLTSFMYAGALQRSGQIIFSLPSPAAGAVYDISEVGVYAA